MTGTSRRRPEAPGDLLGPIDVPFDAMLAETRVPDLAYGHNTGYFPGGNYRYSKTFAVPESWRGRTAILELEGVYQRSKVLLNGHPVGGRPSGYTRFHVVLSGALACGEDTLLEVVAHNDDAPNSRWYTGSGIYRPIHLLLGAAVHVTPTGLRIATTAVEDERATVDVTTEVVNA